MSPARSDRYQEEDLLSGEGAESVPGAAFGGVVREGPPEEVAFCSHCRRGSERVQAVGGGCREDRSRGREAPSQEPACSPGGTPRRPAWGRGGGRSTRCLVSIRKSLPLFSKKVFKTMRILSNSLSNGLWLLHGRAFEHRVLWEKLRPSGRLEGWGGC